MENKLIKAALLIVLLLLSVRLIGLWRPARKRSGQPCRRYRRRGAVWAQSPVSARYASAGLTLQPGPVR